MSSISNLLRIRGHAIWTPPLNSQSVVIDAGAHRGEFSAEIHHRFGCRCIAIEANPTLAAQLPSPPGGQVINAALAATDGNAQFVFRQNLEGGSILPRHGDQGNEKTVVRTLSLDSVCQQAGVRQIDLLKLDIEGAEFSLLRDTSSEILSKIGQITVEFHDFIPEFSGRGLFESARARLESIGFVCCQMAFRTHGDVLFINQKTIHLGRSQIFAVSYLGRWGLKARDQLKGLR